MRNFSLLGTADKSVFGYLLFVICMELEAGGPTAPNYAWEACVRGFVIWAAWEVLEAAIHNLLFTGGSGKFS